MIELKGMLRLEKENNDENLYEHMKRSVKKDGSSKSKERSKAKA